MNRLIEKLEKYPPDLTVKEVIDLIEKRDREGKIALDVLIQEVKNKYENSYLKIHKKGDLFGDEVKFFYISEIVSAEKSSNWENIFRIKGFRILFSKCFLNTKEFDGGGDVYNTMSHKELESMEIITKEEYVSHLKTFNRLKSELEKIVIDNG